MTTNVKTPTGMSEAQKGIGMIVCLATIVLAVLDQNIVSAAAVPIVRELDPVHGMERMPWLISAFALASTAALPLYGKLCDVLGAKRVFIGAVGVFLAGSALCGIAQDMGQLIAFRALQGIGGGGLMSVTMVVIARIKEGEAGGSGRGGSMGGIFAGVGMSVGPFIGGLFADAGNWRWIFYINIPLGVLIIAAAALVLRFPRHSSAHKVDFLGAGLAAAFASGLLLITEWGGDEYAWSSPVVLGLIAATLAMLGLFIWRQAVAAEPILPLKLFTIRVVRLGFAVQGLVGLAMMGSIVYVMTYLMVARGVASSSAGTFMIPMAIGLTAVGLLSGRLAAKGWSTRTFLVSGSLFNTVALLLLGMSGTGTSLWAIRGEMLLIGIGFGQLIGILIMAVQDAAPREHLGVATTGVRFFQTLGGSLGAAIFGSVMVRLYSAEVPGTSINGIARLAGDARDHAVASFVSAVDAVFFTAAAVCLLTALIALRFPTPKPAEPVLAA
ncbi:hypothetical protein Afil01_03980 [Actinorhabdospora filicis]|uniref:Major facilitator superfamily (MFS) profile domain-containing protein n=1 Tax=Actinorhabdospora filicis TaxID=1785913 RepID=A0A9W6W7K9_9ACTN|nr:MFS transporter [Actinorhabdospora filicis]GLZ75591.1 hypothetical protein Afil01_03980 [Actinorhabdospora filicis]